MLKGNIFEIKRFAVHDGGGIRTTVFFKGCSMKCVWCHNPEGISPKKQIAYFENKCVSCGECLTVCRNNAHFFENGVHKFNFDNCTACGKCVNPCFGEALTLYGKEYSLDELLPILLEDKEFFLNSGGGVTVSGGECLLQAEFCAMLLSELKKNGINTAVDTCGFVGRDAIDMVAPFTDIFLYDIKAIDDDVHIKCTGVSNKIVLENLKYIDSIGKNIEIRIPFVPNYNDTEIEKIGEYIKKLKNVIGVKVLPYHNFAQSKYDSLKMQNALPKLLPKSEEINNAKEILRTIGIKVVD